jgi:hypothetical protein
MSVGSSSLARELLTRFDTGHRCKYVSRGLEQFQAGAPAQRVLPAASAMPVLEMEPVDEGAFGSLSQGEISERASALSVCSAGAGSGRRKRSHEASVAFANQHFADRGKE